MRTTLSIALVAMFMLGSGAWCGAVAFAAEGKAPPAAHGQTSHSGPAETPVLENDQVRVVRMRLDAHEKIPMHLLPAHLVVWLTPADLKMTFPDGKSMETHFRRGQATWVAAQKHEGENLGDRPVEFLAVFVKDGGTRASLEH